MAQRYAPAAGGATETAVSKKIPAYYHRIGSPDAVRTGKSLAIEQYWREHRVFRPASIINIR
ncbi:MAG: hypothetical protein IVW54_23325 [Candidatus Binataceae bacterium]|nr:hypothetical protein [Candidatus Binataceae bacterium]